MGIKIAIDGPAASGKSTVAKVLAARGGMVYIDTGAMYRAVALAASNAGVDWADEAGLLKLTEKIKIEIKHDERGQRIFLDGRDVSVDVRAAKMGVGASAVGAFGGVREKMTDIQRTLAREAVRGVVMDGRDIGTVVLPDAEVKIFLTADVEVRARRRCSELEALGLPWDFDEIASQIAKRDFDDSNRVRSPLKQADDAVVLDTSSLDIAGAVDAIEKIIEGSAEDV